MSSSDGHKFSGEGIAHITYLLDNNNIGVWEYHTNSREVVWSAGFYAVLGYEPGEIECSYNYFFENLLYYQDKQAFLKTTYSKLHGGVPTTQIRLLTKANGYQWFESTIQRFDTGDEVVLFGIFTNVNAIKIAELKAADNEFKCAEIGRIAKVGYWQINCHTLELELSHEVYNIFELNTPVKITLDEAISFFLPQYQPVVKAAVEDALKLCKPYDLEVQFKTAKNNVIWVKFKGVPVIDEYGRSKVLKGIFQDIDSPKRRGITLQSSINLLDDQNRRLQNFAYIVSHNLRSHAGNLKFMVNLFEETPIEDDRTEIFAHIKTISESLSATMLHLDEIVKIQAEISKGTKLVKFASIFKNVESTLQANIAASGAQINTDFSIAPEINYIPAYLESILQNLLTNAIKYRHPDRRPVINITTYKTGENIYLIFEDNGLGIDLKRYGNQLFGMYKTFHQHSDSQGIGLFMTRNQIEALGGSIDVESTVNAGTKFTVKLV